MQRHPTINSMPTPYCRRLPRGRNARQILHGGRVRGLTDALLASQEWAGMAGYDVIGAGQDVWAARYHGGSRLAWRMLYERQVTGDTDMSINSIASTPNWWYQQYEAMQPSQSSSGATGTANSSSANSASNTGTTASPAKPTPFFVDFASDLQAMLAQMSGTSSTAAGTTSATTTTADTNTDDQTDSTSSVNGGHHHHHHGSGDGSMQGDATQLVGEAAQTMQNTAGGAGNVATAASTFAGDVVQALQAYGGTAALAGATAAIA